MRPMPLSVSTSLPRRSGTYAGAGPSPARGVPADTGTAAPVRDSLSPVVALGVVLEGQPRRAVRWLRELAAARLPAAVRVTMHESGYAASATHSNLRCIM